MRRPAILGLAVLASALLVSGCTSTARTAADATATGSVASVPVPVSGSVAEPTAVPSSRVAAPCDLAARGAAGVPTERDEPMLVVRYSSYWSPSMRLAPALVIYRSGAIAVARFGGNDGSDARSGDGSPSPFRSYLGGRFSQCALERVMKEFDAFVGVDYGMANVSDCTIADFQRFAPGAPDDPTEFSIDGFGCESIGGGAYPTEGEQGVQYAARARLVNWVDRARTLQGGRGLAMNRVFLVASESGYPLAAKEQKPIPWTAEHLDRKQGCRLLTGASGTKALSLVARAIKANPAVRYGSFVYTADWLVDGRGREMDVMLAPPGIDCRNGR